METLILLKETKKVNVLSVKTKNGLISFLCIYNEMCNYSVTRTKSFCNLKAEPEMSFVSKSQLYNTVNICYF